MNEPVPYLAPGSSASPLLVPHPKEALAFVWTLTSAFAALLATLLYFHVLWRDESQAFVAARDLSLPELFAHMPYEGHPALWHLFLYAITRFTQRPEWMQALHGVMACVTVYVVARWSPFSRLQKILFAFGYFPLFEYGVIARNYQIVLMLAVIFCVVWQRRRTAFWTQGIILALLCHTNIFGIILTAVFGSIVLIEAAITREEHRAAAKHVYRFLGALGLVTISAAIAIWRLIPPADSGYLPKWAFDVHGDHTLQTLASLWSAYVPIPEFTLHFWNSNVVSNHAWEAALGSAVFLMAVVALWKRPGVLAGFVIGTVGVLAFIHIKLYQWINVRYTGNLFILLTVCLWLAWENRRGGLLARSWWTVLLAGQLFASGVAVYVVSGHEWSPSKQAAIYLSSELKPGEIVVTDSESIISALAVYMPGEKFYFPRGDRWGTFAFWDDKRARRGTTEIARRLARDNDKPVILLRRAPMDEQWHVEHLANFDDGVVGDEKFYFYRITPPG